MVHPCRPCRSSQDSGGNPRVKMHNCASKDPTKTTWLTTCGLAVVEDEVDRDYGYTSLCPVCWPWPGPWSSDEPRLEAPWTEDNDLEGDVIPNRLEGEESYPTSTA